MITKNEFEYVSVDKLTPHARNSRTHSEFHQLSRTP